VPFSHYPRSPQPAPPAVPNAQPIVQYAQAIVTDNTPLGVGYVVSDAPLPITQDTLAFAVSV